MAFHYRAAYQDGSTPIRLALIAEEVAAVFPEVAVH